MRLARSGAAGGERPRELRAGAIQAPLD
ncbi:MAG: hypothetical protein QOK40_996, partial [Miltoncostaeaceae bacterium]|nr:hypothetical protein [Miltoncostaeaceae bacterium]